MPREKILLLALPGIGDALLSTPMIRLLRDARPDAEIHALVMFKATRELFAENPDLDQVHFFDFVNHPKTRAIAAALELRKLRFDISINIYPQNRSEYNMLARVIGAKQRLGVRYRRRDSRNLNWLNTATITEDDNLHCVEENVKLLTLLGIRHELNEQTLPRLQPTLGKDHIEVATAWYRRQNFRPGPLIGFHAGTALFKNHIKRRWAPDKFGELARKLKSELGANVLLFGGPDDVEANQVIRGVAGDAIVPVETKSILDSIAIMQGLDLFVSNDSSLMHFAGALELPTVAIFGPTNETYVHPWKTRYKVVQTGIECRPCFVYSPKPLTCYRLDPAEHFLCIRAIEVNEVFAAAKALLSPDLLPVL